MAFGPNWDCNKIESEPMKFVFISMYSSMIGRLFSSNFYYDPDEIFLLWISRRLPI